MKKKTGKRWLAALLAVIMTVGVLPMSALAAGPETDGSSSVVTDREESAEATGAKLVKTAKYDPADGKYTITLESWVTGSVETNSSPVPLDIVLVLDQSGSMEGRNLSNLKTAVRNFVKAINDDAKNNHVEHRISIVGFASNGEDGNWKNTGLFVNGELRNYERLTKVYAADLDKSKTYYYESYIGFRAVTYDSSRNEWGYRGPMGGWHSVTPKSSENDSRNTQFYGWTGLTEADYTASLVKSDSPSITTAINNLSDSGDTYSEYGIEMANNVFKYHPIEGTQRQRVIVMFTDGYTAPYDTDDFKYSMANSAIANAKISKETYQAKVYTVGIFNGADPDRDINQGFKSDDGWRNNENNLTSNEEIVAANRYMHYVSSNYAGVSKLQDSAVRVSGSNFYLTAKDADDLNNVFASISSSVLKPSVKEADDTTIVSDTLSGYFNFAKLDANGKLTDYTVKTVNYAGKDANGNDLWANTANDVSGVTVEVSNMTVTTTGFDYAANAVAVKEDGQPTGKKLVVTFEITPNADANWTEGTNNYPTNATASMGKGSDSFATVPTSPELPVTAYKVTYGYDDTAPGNAPTIEDKTNYIKGQTVTVKYPNGTFDWEGYTYTFDGWTSDDVTISSGTFTMPDKNVTLTGSWSKTAKAANYKVEYYLQNLAGDGYDKDTDPTRTREVASTTGASVSENPAAIEGFTFDENNTNNVLSGTVAANGSTVLKLYYTRNSYEVSYAYTGDVHPDPEPAAPATVSYKYGAPVTVEDVPSVTGYTFHGWNAPDGLNVTDGKFTMPADNVTLTGYWTKDDVITEVTVTFEVVNGTWKENGSTTKTVTVKLTNGVGHLADGDIPTPTPNAGYSNGRWDVEPTTTMDVHDGDKFIYTYTKLPTIILGGDGDGHLNIKKDLATTGYVESINETFTVNITEYGYAAQPAKWDDFRKASDAKFSGSVTMTAAGTASFGSWTVVTDTPADSRYTFDNGTLTFKQAGVYIFKVQEAEGRTAGMHYDTSEYGLAVAVAQDEETGDLYIAMYTALANLYPSTINDFIKNYQGTYHVNHEITIANLFEGDPDTFAVKLGDFVKKTYTSTYGWSNTADFTFTATINEEAISNSLTAEEAPKPATDLSKPITGTVRITTGQTLDVNFGTIYLEEGTYFVEVSEIKGNATDVKYDDTVYYFTIVIELDSEGKPVIEYHNLMSRTPEGQFIELERGAKAEFKNEYTYYYFNPNPPTPPTPELNTEDHVAYLIGFTDGTIRPEANITRGEVATIFFRLLTDEARTQYWSQTNSYSDVPADLWCNNAISTLSNMGIINGYLDGTFRPSAPITRSELTKIAVSFFKYADINKFAYDGRFPDVKGDEWYVRYLAASVEFGLIEGDGNGMFRPNDPITRAETCTIVNRTLGRKPDAAHLLGYGVMITWPDNSNINAWYYAAMQEATNSHDYTWITVNQAQVENWTAKLTERDWAALERMWSNANSAPGGEVMG